MAAPPQYSKGPYSTPSALPAPPRSEVHSSRKINAETKEYELDPVTGGNLSMPSTAQRVLIAVTKATPTEAQRFITPNEQAAQAASIRAAIRFLVDDGSIELRSDAISLSNPEQGTSKGIVNYKSLKKDIDQSVQT